jgi:hypothetical protein
MEFNYTKLADGMIYYKNAVPNPQSIIDNIESLEEKRKNSKGYVSKYVKPWTVWDYDNGGDQRTFFCLQKFLPNPKDIDPSDTFYNEQLQISKSLFDPLEDTLNHYFTLYPFAKTAIKSREDMMHVLKYEKAGFLPKHSDHGKSSRVLSVLLYLNEDYEGGEISWPDVGVTLKPEAGSIIYFPSNYVFTHEVAPIISGVRYALPNWFHNRKERYESDGTD